MIPILALILCLFSGLAWSGLNISRNTHPNCGYYDQNMVWRNVDPPQSTAYFNAMTPRPAGFVVGGSLELNENFLSTLPADSASTLRGFMQNGTMLDFITPQRLPDGTWRLTYAIGSMRLPVPSGMGPLDRNTMKAAILAAREADVDENLRPVLRDLQRQVNTPEYNNRLLREYACSSIANASTRNPGINCTNNSEAENYALERMKYFLRGFQSQARAATNPRPNYHETPPPRRVGGCPEDADDPNYQFSLTPFKKGDLDARCKEQVDNGVSQGFQSVTLFFPVHYSGGNTGQNHYGTTARQMREGWDYQYEDANMIDDQELHRCLRYIQAAGLTLNYVPHQESIVTMNSSGESEWRINSAIPPTDSYYQRAYGGLMSYLSAHPEIAPRDRPIRVAAAAEIDPAFLGNTDAALSMTQRLRRELGAAGVSSEISWMPNGDFHNGWTPTAIANLNCGHMVELLGSFDRISPSIYQAYQHVYDSTGSVATGSDVSFVQTREHFFAGMGQRFRDLCPSQAAEMERVARSRSFSIGEFALSEGNYSAFADEMHRTSPNSDATFWSSGEWDHAGITGPSSDPDHGREIAGVVSPCAPAVGTPRRPMRLPPHSECELDALIPIPADAANFEVIHDEIDH